MYVMLSKNSFIRSYDEYGYIINQMTDLDRLYNKSGKLFLDQISRMPKSAEEIVDNLYKIFIGTDRKQIEIDFIEFITDLESEHYVIIGEDEETIASKDIAFSYDFEGVKTTRNIFLGHNDSYPSPKMFFFENINKKNYYLIHIYLELTRKCNERCVHCYIPDKDKNHGLDMTLEDAKSYISQASEINTLSITLTGGEPFLNKHITDILFFAREKDMMISILSNITPITEEYIKTLKDVNVSRIQVSLYSLNPEIHDLITKSPGSFNKTFRTINRLLEEDIPVQISCPIMKHNYKDSQDVLKWAYKHHVKAYTDINLNAKYDGNKENLCHAPTNEMIREFLKDTLKNDKDWKEEIENNYSRGVYSNRNLHENICGAGIDTLYISADGRILPCVSWESYPVGNLKEQTLKEIWEQSSQLTKLRNLKINDYPDYFNSEYKEFISLCPARFASHSNGDFLKIPEATIEQAKLKKEIVDNYIENSKN